MDDKLVIYQLFGILDIRLRLNLWDIKTKLISGTAETGRAVLHESSTSTARFQRSISTDEGQNNGTP